MRQLVLFFFLFSICHAEASFEKAKAQYEKLCKISDSEQSQLHQEATKITQPILETISKKSLERENCASFECAKQIDNEISDLNKSYDETWKPYNEKITLLKIELAHQSNSLAVEAYREETSLFFAAIPEVKILSQVDQEVCEQDHPLPNPNMVCKMSTYEFSKNKVFYRTQILFGIGHSSPDEARFHLDNLFSQDKNDFLLGKNKEASPALNQSLTVRTEYNVQNYEYQNGHYTYSFGPTKVGFFSFDIEHSP